MSDLQETLIAAKATVEAGWNQYGLTNGRGGFCLRAAIGLASGAYELIDGEVGIRPMFLPTDTTESLSEYFQTFRTDLAAMRLVADHLPEGFDSIPLFNDHPQTTQEDVLAVLDKAVAA